MSGRGLGRGRLFRNRRGRYEFEWTDANRGVHRRVLSPDRRVAERIAADIIKKRNLADKGLGNEDGMGRPVAEVVAAYIDDLRASRSAAYANKVDTDLTRLGKFLGAVRVRDVTVPLMLRRRKERIGEKVSHATVNHEAGAMRACLNWAVRAGTIGANPLALLKPCRKRRPTRPDLGAQ